MDHNQRRFEGVLFPSVLRLATSAFLSAAFGIIFVVATGIPDLVGGTAQFLFLSVLIFGLISLAVGALASIVSSVIQTMLPKAPLVIAPLGGGLVAGVVGAAIADASGLIAPVALGSFFCVATTIATFVSLRRTF